MTTQLNLRVSDELLATAKNFAKLQGYLNVQEFIREAMREKVEENLRIRPEYLKMLQSKEANTFLSDKEQKEFEGEFDRRVAHEKRKIQQAISKKGTKAQRSRAN